MTAHGVGSGPGGWLRRMWDRVRSVSSMPGTYKDQAAGVKTPRHVVVHGPPPDPRKAAKRAARLQRRRQLQAISPKPWSKRRLPRDSAEWRVVRKMSVRARRQLYGLEDA